MDIQGFFYNINTEILYRIIAKRVRDEAILWLARVIIFHDCTKDVVFKGDKGLMKEVPAHFFRWEGFSSSMTGMRKLPWKPWVFKT